MDTVAELQAALREFAKVRDWEKYHTPRNLSALIASEAGELLALFRWDQDALGENKTEVERELADVFLGLLRFADVTGIDLVSAAEAKLRLNGERYPVSAAGRPDRAKPHD